MRQRRCLPEVFNEAPRPVLTTTQCREVACGLYRSAHPLVLLPVSHSLPISSHGSREIQRSPHDNPRHHGAHETEHRMDTSELVTIAARQDGCITKQQVLNIVQRGQLEYLISARALVKLHPNTYVVAGFPDNWRQQSRAAALSLPGSILSHESAGRAWGMLDEANPRVHLSASPHKASPRDGVIVHRIRELDTYRSLVDEIPVTTPARTLIDLAETLRPQQLESCVDRAINNKLVTTLELFSLLNTLAAKGRPRAASLRKILTEWQSVRSHSSLALTRRIIRWLRDAKLPAPTAPYSLHIGHRRYEIDAAYDAAKIALVVESDRPQTLHSASKNEARDARLTTHGWTVLHVDTNDTAETLIPLLRDMLALEEAN